jgi:hypothetical protein
MALDIAGLLGMLRQGVQLPSLSTPEAVEALVRGEVDLVLIVAPYVTSRGGTCDRAILRVEPGRYPRPRQGQEGAPLLRGRASHLTRQRLVVLRFAQHARTHLAQPVDGLLR